MVGILVLGVYKIYMMTDKVITRVIMNNTNSEVHRF